MSLLGNKGEWSEIYALIKLLSDKTLYGGDEDLNKVEELIYPIIKIIRHESAKSHDYVIDGDIIIVSDETEKLRIPIERFNSSVSILLSKIKNADGTFRIPEMESFLSDIRCTTLKAKSSVKSDITIVIHDTRLNKNETLGFSIKSLLGGDATLLNAGKTTNFIFEIKGVDLSTDAIEGINKIDTKSKIRDRIQAIAHAGGTLTYTDMEQDIFKNNLILIDSKLPDILSEIILAYYRTNLTTIRALTEHINETNPITYDKKHNHAFYVYKMKRFLTDVAVGMMPSKVWSGTYDATGGYLIVKKDGEVLCYHLYNRNQFENYLFESTKLETASSTRHDFGKIYKENDKLFFKLNLQVRFK